jgi:hypothetical protein
MAHFSERAGATLERCTRPLSLVVGFLLVVGGFWIHSAQTRDLRDGYYGCHTNNSTVTGVRSFWVATLKDGRLVAMEPDAGSPGTKTFAIASNHGSGVFNVTVNGHITATCESDD